MLYIYVKEYSLILQRFESKKALTHYVQKNIANCWQAQFMKHFQIQVYFMCRREDNRCILILLRILAMWNINIPLRLQAN